MTGSDASRILQQLASGDATAGRQLFELVYSELRMLAGRYLKSERVNHTLDATALVHEAYVRLVDQPPTKWQGKAHFYAVAAQAMRRILIDHARRRNRDKRGGGRHAVNLSDAADFAVTHDADMVALGEALERLEQLDARQAKVVELRFFSGLSMAEIAEAMGVSERTAHSDWAMARAWLALQLAEKQPPSEPA